MIIQNLSSGFFLYCKPAITHRAVTCRESFLVNHDDLLRYAPCATAASRFNNLLEPQRVAGVRQQTSACHRLQTPKPASTGWILRRQATYPLQQANPLHQREPRVGGRWLLANTPQTSGEVQRSPRAPGRRTGRRRLRCEHQAILGLCLGYVHCAGSRPNSRGNCDTYAFDRQSGSRSDRTDKPWTAGLGVGRVGSTPRRILPEPSHLLRVLSCGTAPSLCSHSRLRA